MFMGEHQHSIDEKGRLFVPARFREELGLNFVVTRGLDNCLFVFPKAEWQNMEHKLKTLPLTNASARSFVRFFFSGANECELDKQGRILLPPNLREYARLERDVVIIGVSSRLEIWSRQEWEKYSQQADESFEEIAEKIVDLGI